MFRLPPNSLLFPYTTLFRSLAVGRVVPVAWVAFENHRRARLRWRQHKRPEPGRERHGGEEPQRPGSGRLRSEEHTSELQSLTNLVCRLLLEKKKKKIDKS